MDLVFTIYLLGIQINLDQRQIKQKIGEKGTLDIMQNVERIEKNKKSPKNRKELPRIA